MQLAHIETLTGLLTQPLTQTLREWRAQHMTKKDFCLIADVIKELPSFECKQDDDVVHHSAIVERFASALAGTNPRFDRQRFIAACNGKQVQR